MWSGLVDLIRPTPKDKFPVAASTLWKESWNKRTPKVVLDGVTNLTTAVASGLSSHPFTTDPRQPNSRVHPLLDPFLKWSSGKTDYFTALTSLNPENIYKRRPNTQKTDTSSVLKTPAQYWGSTQVLCTRSKMSGGKWSCFCSTEEKKKQSGNQSINHSINLSTTQSFVHSAMPCHARTCEEESWLNLESPEGRRRFEATLRFFQLLSMLCFPRLLHLTGTAVSVPSLCSVFGCFFDYFLLC